MIPLTVKFCVGCGQVLDELESFDCRPSPIAAEVYREVYVVRRIDSRMGEEVCASCAGLLAIRTPH
jgi:hypothetical protein